MRTEHLVGIGFGFEVWKFPCPMTVAAHRHDRVFPILVLKLGVFDLIS